MLLSDIKIIEDELKKLGELSSKKRYKELIDFSINILKAEQSFKIQGLNKQISDGISGLSMNNQWTNLIDISKHAITACLSSIDKDSFVNTKSIKDIIRFKSFILHAGKKEFIDYLTDEAKEKFFNIKKEV